MKRRYGILLSMALLAGLSGCAGTARRDDGSSIFGPKTWNAPAAPPQRAVSLAPDGSVVAADPAPSRVGLSKYFPGLLKKPTEEPVIASAKPRPTWFGLRPPKPAPAAPVTYMTDTREHLNRTGSSPTQLPGSLQVAAGGMTGDRQVTPASGETIAQTPSQKTSSVEDAAPKPDADLVSASARPLDFWGEPAKSGEDDVKPLAPAAEPGSPAAVVNRMPPTPLVDPLSSPSTDRLTLGRDDTSASDAQTVKASATPVEPTSPIAQEPSKQPTVQVVTSAQVVTPTSQVYASPQTPPKPPTKVLPAPTKIMPVPTKILPAPTKVLPAPTKIMPAPSKVLPTSQAKPTPQVMPTSQAKPSPQAAGASDTHQWQRPCLRRLVRRVCGLGEFADPPTAAPH